MENPLVVFISHYSEASVSMLSVAEPPGVFVSSELPGVLLFSGAVGVTTVLLVLPELLLVPPPEGWVEG